MGDSRVYRIRDGSIAKITRDQSVMEQQIASGLMTEKEAKDAKYLVRNTLDMAIYYFTKRNKK